MSSVTGKCPVCHGINGKCIERPETDSYYWVCSTCGEFEITHHAVLEIDQTINPKKRAHISGLLRDQSIRRKQRNRPLFIVAAHFAGRGGSRPNSVNVGDLLVSFPLGVQDKLDKLLENLVLLSPHEGAEITFKVDEDRSLAYADNSAAFHFLLRQLHNQGILLLNPGHGSFNAVVTVDGWNRFAELQRGKQALKPLQGFVAMWFDPNRRQEWEPGLKQGIEAAGYLSRIIDQKEYIGSITDEIIAEIRSSKFVVADLTGQRANVFFEAGFAEGLGIPVFYTCNYADIEKLPFDKRQENVVAWTSIDDLTKRLRARIEAVIGRPPDHPRFIG